MEYFYGPVPSRRLGFSLGVDLLPKKACSFDCIYCQVGRTTIKTIRRFFYIDLEKFKNELTGIMKKSPRIDYISIAGSGEPTLHKDLDIIISTIKEITENKYPVCVITNSSLLYRKEIRNELKEADLIIPSLDAGLSRTFRMINKPHKEITFKKIIQGLIDLRGGFKGEIWLEIMLVGRVNDMVKEAEELKKIIPKIRPDKVQIVIPIRPAGYLSADLACRQAGRQDKIILPSSRQIDNIKKILGEDVEIIDYSSVTSKQEEIGVDAEEEILKYVKRRPASLEDLTVSLGMDVQQIERCIDELLCKEKIKIHIHNGKKYIVCND